MLVLTGIVIAAGFAGAAIDRLLWKRSSSITKEYYDMTVQQIKDRIQQGKLDIIAAGTSEAAEIKVLITAGGGSAGGATQSQLDELGEGVNDLASTAVATINAISDNAQAPAPGNGGGNPLP